MYVFPESDMGVVVVGARDMYNKKEKRRRSREEEEKEEEFKEEGAARGTQSREFRGR